MEYGFLGDKQNDTWSILYYDSGGLCTSFVSLSVCFSMFLVLLSSLSLSLSINLKYETKVNAILVISRSGKTIQVRYSRILFIYYTYTSVMKTK